MASCQVSSGPEHRSGVRACRRGRVSNGNEVNTVYVLQKRLGEFSKGMSTKKCASSSLLVGAAIGLHDFCRSLLRNKSIHTLIASNK